MGGKCDFDSGSNSYTSFYTKTSSVDWIDTHGNGLAYAAFKLSTQEKKKETNKQKIKMFLQNQVIHQIKRGDALHIINDYIFLPNIFGHRDT